MFNIGGGELIVIMLIALIVLGPQRLPDAARQIGKTLGDLRRMSTGFQNEMRSALEVADQSTTVSARRNVLAKEAVTEPPAEEPTDPAASPVAGAVKAVSARPPAAEPKARAARTAPSPGPKKAGAKKPAPGATKKAAAAKKAASATTKKVAAPKKGAAKATSAAPGGTAPRQRAAPTTRRTNRG